jgi:hypothetical protein
MTIDHEEIFWFFTKSLSYFPKYPENIDLLISLVLEKSYVGNIAGHYICRLLQKSTRTSSSQHLSLEEI